MARLATLAPPRLAAGFSWDVPADLSERAVQERLSGPAVAGFFRLAASWKLRDEDARQLLGGISNGTFYQWKSRSGGRHTGSRRLNQDELTRISLLLGIFKALNILYSPKLAAAWVQLPNRNPLFRGETPLAYMLRGGLPGVLAVRRLLDARRGGR
jgi:hypothetical protein